MALTIPQQAAVDALKPLLGDTTLTDDAIWEILDATNGQPFCAAADIWTMKAADSADLITVKEGSSTRQLGDVHNNYRNMADYYRQLCNNDSAQRAARSRPIARA